MTAEARALKFPLILVGVLTASAFGPYLVGNIRTEQLGIYGAAVTLLPFTFVRARPYLPVFLPWIAIIVVALLGLIPPTAHSSVYEPGNMLSSLDNLVLPIMILLLVWGIVPTDQVQQSLRIVASITVYAAAANGVLSIVGTSTDISTYLRPFWGAEGGQTTADRAAELGRLSGIFNQPAEAGVMYGIAGILAVWRYRHKPKTLLLLLALISVGGMLCVSKVFILGGIPLILAYLWMARAGLGRAGMLFGVALTALGIAQSGLLQQWTGYNYLARLFAPSQDQGLIEFYSAGRWNEDAGMISVFDAVIRSRPITGFGISGLQVPYDSAWTEAAVVAGFLGVFFLAAVYGSLLMMARRVEDGGLRLLATFIVLFLLGASLGIPALTANRASTVVWVVLGLLCLAGREAEKAKPANLPQPYRLSNRDTKGAAIRVKLGHELLSSRATRHGRTKVGHFATQPKAEFPDSLT